MTYELTARGRGFIEGKKFAAILPGFRPAFLYLDRDFRLGFEEGRAEALAERSVPQADGDAR